MKKSFILFSACTLLSIGASYAQAPARFNYQGIARTASGSPLANQAVGLRISVLDGSATGTVVYSETQMATTNAFGLYTLAIGGGTVGTGTLAGVNWNSGSKYIHVEIDPTGGTSYADLGTTQLLSVPYALSAGAPTLTLTGSTLSAGGNSVTLPAAVPPTLTLTGNVLSAGGNSVTIPASSAPVLTLTGNVLSAGANSVTLPSSSAPVLTLSGNSLSAGANSVTLPPPTLTLSGNALSAGGNSVTLPSSSAPILTLTGNSLSAGANSVTLPSSSAPILTLSGNSLSAGANSVTLPAPTLTLTGNSLSAGGNSITLPAATPPTLTLTGNVLSAGGNSVTLPSGSGGGISGTANYVPKFATATTLGNSSIMENAAGKIGIGTTTLGAAKVEIATTDTMALRVTSNSTTGTWGGVLNVQYTGTNSTTNSVGIRATAAPGATAGAGIGMWGQGGLLGVYGIGQANVTAGNIFGVRGEAYSDGTAFGVYGSSSSYGAMPAGSKYGVIGFAEDGNINVGIYGDGGTTGTTNLAGYFVGDVQVNGSIAKSAGTFKIDHPQDPANKYLYHSFVESPDMMNVYNGNIVTDANGYATVTLPAYFESLNKDFRYQLTVVGATFAQAIVSEKVQGNRFQIRTNQPGTEVSWQVTGIRNDAYAKAHRVQPEVDKEADNKGKYLNPVELGKPANLQIGKLEKPASPAKAELRK